MKKVLLFIVEGANDSAALAKPLENLQCKNKPGEQIRFAFTNGDITSNPNTKNIKNEVTRHVKMYCDGYGMSPSRDINRVVLLFDTDGVYIPDCARVHSDGHEDPFYDENTILYDRVDNLIKIHERKRKNLEILIGLKKIFKTIPFDVYFVSCNFDHVVCGNANLTKKQKSKTADDFAKQYENDAESLYTFLNDPALTLGNDYNNSWELIKQGLTSLHRHSNMNVFLDKHYPQPIQPC
ncbi:MAG: hypothetical protein FWE90_04555 [Defluviitaleaceae bacterium]|nr:hypothetical protein [Defluviitaleaceae bacterium]